MPRKRRTYDASGRREAAEETRRSILAAAKRLFVERGYAATTMPDIATAAGVALDTVYASIGKKPELFRLLVEAAISGEDRPVPAVERAYVKTVQAEPNAARKLAIYAAAVCVILPRLAPLARVLAEAAAHDPALKALWASISTRRAENMRLFARELQATGSLRPELTIDTVADVIWSMNGPEYYHLLVEQRGWSLEHYEQWLASAWARLLLDDTAT